MREEPHAFSLNDRLLRVPVVVSGPGADALPETMTSLGELPRLIARLAGLDDHPWIPDDLPPEGIAVAQLNPPLDPDHPRVEAIRREWNLDVEAIDRLTCSFTAATDGRFKLIRGAGREVLYDPRPGPSRARAHPAELAGCVGWRRASNPGSSRRDRAPLGTAAGRRGRRRSS